MSPPADVLDRLNQIDASQSALLTSAQSLHEQMSVVTSLVAQLIQLLTLKPDEGEGEKLSDLIARLIQQQTAQIGLLKQTLEAIARIEARTLPIAAAERSAA